MRLHDLYFGALRAPGRWHRPVAGGQRAVVYTAGSRALAQLEKRVHCNGIAPVDQALLRLELGAGATLLDAVADLKLKRTWAADEAYTQSFGNDWFAKGQSLGLWVPSYVEPRERNLLLNSSHAQYDTHVKVVIEVADFEFDPRMF
ncbi:MAG: RES family NAD+ phosphorylase [Deltaproteobacteria bacterium]|nr:RES family NAD+ phosphorylase [Deltaproteobacteria bacterium]